MPIVKTIDGDLIEMFKEKQFNGIAHGCNCFHTMGAGIALHIAKKFKKALTVDEATVLGDNSKLGQFSKTTTKFGDIYNLYTQHKPGNQIPVVLYKAIRDCFLNLKLDDEYILGIPKIGAGLAGGNWHIIEQIINENTNYKVIVVNFVK
jgi:O-acetyl-ADP-ribose deacetylase (regulator of RNase III)